MQHTCTTMVTYATSRSTFATSIQNTCNIPLNHLKHLKHTLATCVFSANATLLLGRIELVIVELNAGAEVGARAWSSPVRQRSSEHYATWTSTTCARPRASLMSTMAGASTCSGCGVDWEEGRVTWRKVLWRGMERAARDEGAARLMAARTRR